ncbi:uncharacterized protein LOC129890564 [Solanum dulcamara]|uniref:uncharacterized protein LOC129890564 n=1 Tax=Solanum dulcamara TaxID=45834 RepID=UPI002485113F|nr:uncharacterized protein LOC129890564 [Solanum dulcamara]
MDIVFNGSARQDGARIGVVLISPERLILSFSFVLDETCSNNTAEYQALIVGLEMASDMKIPQLNIYSDSKVIINQHLGSYKRRKSHADALANLATTMALRENRATKVRVCHRWVIPGCLDLQINESHHTLIRVVEEEDWRKPLIEYLEHGRLPEDLRKRADIKRRAPRFIFHQGILFRHSYKGLFLWCLDKEEAQQTMEEVHSSICGAHQSGPKLFFWHQEYELLLANNGDGLSRACQKAKAVPLKEVEKENVVAFIKSSIIFRYGIPRCIVTYNGTPFNKKLMRSLCEKFSFKQHKSSVYNAPANGLAEAFNKILRNLLKKVVAKNKKGRHERIGEAFWEYHTTFRNATQVTPYSLVYGVEVVRPLEKYIPSLRIAIQEGLTTENNAQLRLAELEALDEKKLEA